MLGLAELFSGQESGPLSGSGFQFGDCARIVVIASFRGFVSDQQVGPAGPGDEFSGGGEEAVAPPFHVPSPGCVAGWQRG